MTPAEAEKTLKDFELYMSCSPKGELVIRTMPSKGDTDNQIRVLWAAVDALLPDMDTSCVRVLDADKPYIKYMSPSIAEAFKIMGFNYPASGASKYLM